MMSWLKIYNDREKIDHAWLFRVLGESYWGARLSKVQILKAIDASLCFSAFVQPEGQPESQIGFARVVTDGAIFSSVMDVIVEENRRFLGVGTTLMRAVVTHPLVAPTICILNTRDADKFYERFGFERRLAVMKRDPS